MATGHRNVNFKVLDMSNFSAEATGILGRFLPKGAYEVRPNLADPTTGFLLFNGKMTEVNYKRHAWTKNCWTLSQADFLEMVDLAQIFCIYSCTLTVKSFTGYNLPKDFLAKSAHEKFRLELA